MSAADRGYGTILLLAAIAALGSLGTQLIIPALPTLASDLHTGADDAQLVVSLFLLGLGAGQLLFGPMVDRIGRKPVLLAGLALYCLASFAAALATSFPLLVAARLFQALGGSAGIVTSRVLVGDLYPADQVAAKQATLMSVVLISPALAPVIGGLLTEVCSWRWLFALLALGGIAAAALSWFALPETQRAASAAKQSKSSFATVLCNRKFLAAAGSIIGGSATLYMFLGTAPFLLTGAYRLGPRDVGLCLMVVAACSIAGTLLVGRIERSGDAMLTGAFIMFIAAALLLALGNFTSLAAFLGPSMLLGLGAGISGPAGIARVVQSQPGMEGTATSLAGGLQMQCSALAAFALSRFAPVDIGTLALAGLLTTGIALAASLMVRKSRGVGDPAQATGTVS